MPQKINSAKWNNTYARLPERFYTKLNPTPVSNPTLVRLNKPLAQLLGLNVKSLDSEQTAAIFAGNVIPPGAEPLAQAYAGHQFGHFAPQLGDGRAILLGEVLGTDGLRRDIQLKGSGPTPFSRRGDGRAALGPVIREFILGESMFALGIPTTRGLAFVTTGETVLREKPWPGAILTRVAASHIRVGTFQYFAARKDVEALKILADYTLARHYPEALKEPVLKKSTEAGQPYLVLLDAVIKKQAQLISQWMHAGFIHGVMNTDNMSISGETIDYGPCAFLDTYDPAKVFSSIDQQSRYAYENQPSIALWNLTRFAETLLPLLDDNQDKAVALAEESLNRFHEIFAQFWLQGLRPKLGLASEQEGDIFLGENFLNVMHKNGGDFTSTFRALSAWAEEESAIPAVYKDWAAQWKNRLAQESHSILQSKNLMNSHNPIFIPRNHRVEEAIEAAVEHADFTVMDTLMDVLSQPFKDQPKYAAYSHPPLTVDENYQTFCGT